MSTRRSSRGASKADAADTSSSSSSSAAAASATVPVSTSKKNDPRRKSFFDQQNLVIPESSPVVSTWSADVSSSGRKNRKRRSSTSRETTVTDAEADSSSSSSTAAAAPPAKASKKQAAPSKASVDGFEFSKKQKTGATTSVAVSSSSSSKSVTAAAPTSSSASSSSSSAPHMPAPAYPSSASTSTKFTFHSDKPLAEATHQLFADILASEQALVAKTYGAGSKHKSASAGQLQFVVEALKNVGNEFLATVDAAIAGEVKSAQSSVPVLENPKNVELRDELEKWTRLAKQAEADIETWKKLNEGLAAQKPGEAVVAKLGAADEEFLQTHQGGKLTRDIAAAYTAAAVKGDASLHALERLHSFVQSVAADQKHISATINKEEKKAYGKSVEDPKQLISLMTQGADTPAATN